MRTNNEGRPFAPTRLLEMLEWRFGAFEAIANSVLSAATFDPDLCPPMDAATARAILEFGDDLRQSSEAAEAWMERQSKEMTTKRARPKN